MKIQLWCWSVMTDFGLEFLPVSKCEFKGGRTNLTEVSKIKYLYIKVCLKELKKIQKFIYTKTSWNGAINH